MTIERTLSVLRTQLQFELLQAGAAVAESSNACARIQRQVDECRGRCDQLSHGLRDVLGDAKTNPEMMQVMHRMYRAESNVLRESERELADAAARDEQLRAELASLRNRERSLQQALQAQRSKQRARLQAKQIIIADDLWLQRRPA